MYERGQRLERDGLLDAARELYERTLRGTAGLSPADAAQLVRYVARTYMHDAEYDAARDCASCALAIAQQSGDLSGEGHATNILAVLEWKQGHLDAARALYLEARTLAQAAGDARLAVMTASNLGVIENVQGDERAAREAYESSLADARNAGLADQVIAALGNLGQLETQAGQLAMANMIVQGETARELADLYRAQGRNRQTLQRLNQAHRLFAQLRARRELADVDRRTAVLENDFLDVVRRWGESIESKDMYTQGHCVRVSDLACALWMRVQDNDTSLFWFRIGALLHDVGKLMVPAEVLNKPGKLTAEEWTLVRGHPLAGVELLADIEFPWDVRPMVESHHERWDGCGYPHGLAGEEIPLMARVLCIADVYDALTSIRSYKRAFTHDEALALMREDVGRQFDPAVFAEFDAMVSHATSPGPEVAGTAGRHLTLLS